MVMNANDVLNQTREGKCCRIQGHCATLLGLGCGELFQDLIDRKLQFLARSFQ